MSYQDIEATDAKIEPVHLKCFHYLAGLDTAALERLLSISVKRRYRKGMILCLEGEPIDAIHFVMKGRVKLTITSEEGREQILALPGPGELFPYTSFLNGDCCSATAQALAETVTLAIRPEQLRALLMAEPTLATAFLVAMAERIHFLEETVRDLSLRTVPGRIARVLLSEASRFGDKVEGGYEFPFRFTQQELAHLVGATRETVSRTLSSFRRAGALRPGRKGRVYADLERLRAWL